MFSCIHIVLAFLLTGMYWGVYVLLLQSKCCFGNITLKQIYWNTIQGVKVLFKFFANKYISKIIFGWILFSWNLELIWAIHCMRKKICTFFLLFSFLSNVLILNCPTDDAQAFLTDFGKEYLKMFGAAMLERIAAEVEGEEAETRKLSYRDVSLSTNNLCTLRLFISKAILCVW